MGWILDLYRSAVFKKYVMAVTGVMLFGFVLSHMAGNPPTVSVEYARKCLLSHARPTFAEVEEASDALPAPA